MSNKSIFSLYDALPKIQPKNLFSFWQRMVLFRNKSIILLIFKEAV